jgi:polar amino acid transport system ATP-binding protein
MSLCIEIQHLTKRYGDHVVLDDVNLSIEQGETVVIQGPSGVGKSTLLRCLTHLEPFDGGLIRVGDITLRAGMNEKDEHRLVQSLREQVGFVFQFFNLFPHLTVLENLTLAPRLVQRRPADEVQKEARTLLERVGLAEKADVRPNVLSGGQKQRVGIARALAMRPRAVLFDEPTSALDPEMKEDVVDVIESFADEGLTLVLVTHEPAVVGRIAGRVIKLGPAGRVLADDPGPRGRRV